MAKRDTTAEGIFIISHPKVLIYVYQFVLLLILAVHTISLFICCSIFSHHHTIYIASRLCTIIAAFHTWRYGTTPTEFVQ
jgi:hypothetical protein